MIFDKVENMECYFKTLPVLKEVKEFYDSYKAGEKPESNYQLDGENLKVNISSYAPKAHEGAEYESHREYIDVQIVAKGREYIGWSHLSDCVVTKDFEDGGDIAFYTGKHGSLCLVEEDMFMVLYPQDAHMPCLKVEDGDEVTKLVYKVKI